MRDTSRLGVSILAAAAVLGALGAWLFEGPPGFGFTCWLLALFAAAALLIRRESVVAGGDGRLLLVPLLLLAVGFSFRDSEGLKAVTLLALLASLSLCASTLRTGSLRRSGLLTYLASGLAAFFQGLGGVLLLLTGDIKWKELPVSGRSGHLAAVLRGLVIAVPMLLVFGALFVAADAAFEQMVGSLIVGNLESLMERVILAGIVGWWTAGLLRQALLKSLQLTAGTLFAPHPAASAGAPEEASAGLQRPSFSLGAVESGVALGLLNVLFVAFVLVQFRWFFGGAGLVEASDVTYAEYARRGFFELIAVAALVLPVLLVFHWTLPPERPAQERLYRYLAGSLVAMLFIIMASAAHRLSLYTAEFGLTESRLYATAFMLWLAVLFGWFCASVLRGRRDRFAFGALAAGLSLIGLLYIVNPDALIIRTNLARMDAGRPFDPQYAAGLSADSVPYLLEALPRMTEASRAVVAGSLLRRWGSERTEWRSSSWGREVAIRLVQQRRHELAAMTECLKQVGCDGRKDIVHHK
jgi:hypothetical protein